jgi:hypothetical protein
VLNLPYKRRSRSAQVAQLVEQRTENPCVGGSIPPLGTTDVSGSYATLSSASAAAGDAAQFPLSQKTRVGEMAAMGVNSPAEPRAIKISWNAAPSRAGRVDAGGIVARRPRFAIVLERPANGGEGEFRPRDFGPIEKPHLEALGSRLNRLFQ